MDENNSRNTPDDLKKPKKVYRRPQGADMARRSRSTRKKPNPSDGYEDISSFTKKKRNVKLIVTNVLLSVLLVVSGLGFTGATILDARLFRNSEIDKPETNENLEELQFSESRDVAYFLVVGLDLSQDLTDIMMVVCYDLANNKVNILQLPRDTFIGADVPTGKLNAVYGHPREGESKIKALMRCINQKFGLPIDHYITITIPGFRDIIDAMGGVTMTLDREYTVEDSRPVDTGGKAVKIKIGPGTVTLKGYEAEGFVRHRNSYVKGDLGRMEAQRRFYSAVAKKLTNLSAGQLVSIAQNCLDDISSDMQTKTLLGYAQKISGMDLKNIAINAIPGQSGTYRPTGWALSYYSVHKQELVDMLNEEFRPYETSVLTVDDITVEELHSSYQSNNMENGFTFSDLEEE